MKSLINFYKNLSKYLLRFTIPGVLIIPYKQTKTGLKYLLIKSLHSQAITFPSGTLNLTEDFKEAAERELLEETGIIAQNLRKTPIKHHFCYRNLPIKFKSIQSVYLGEIKTRFNKEILEKDILWTRWLKFEDVLKLLEYPELKSTFIKVRKYLHKIT